MAESSTLPVIEAQATLVPRLAFAAVTLILLYIGYRRALPKPIPGIPYNASAVNSLFGDIPPMMAYMAKTQTVFPWVTQQIARHQSPIVQVFGRPFSKPWVLVADHRENQDILLRRTKEFDRSNFIGDTFAGALPDFHIRMKSNDEQFKIHRNLLKDLMTPGFLHEVAAPEIYTAVKSWIKLWELKAQLAQGHAFAADADIFNVALDVIFGATFSLDAEDSIITSQLQQLSAVKELALPVSQDAAVSFPTFHRPTAFESVVTITDSVEISLKAPFPKLAHWVLRQMPYLRKAQADKECMIRDEIEKGIKRLQSGDRKKRSAVDDIFQRELAAAKKEGREPVYHSRMMYDELLGFLVGGHDTSSSAVLWGLKYLTAYPGAQGTLRSKLRAAHADATEQHRDPMIEEITKISVPYLDATIEEILRLALLFPGVPRMATCDTTILGHAIPKGTDVWLLQTTADYYSPAFPIAETLRSETSRTAKLQVGRWNPARDDMTVFQPERWLIKDEAGNEAFDPQAGPHLAFGLGPRGCFGRRLAYLELRVLLTMLIWNFELQTVSEDLSGWGAIDKMVRHPQQCYVRLAKATW